MGSSDAAIEPGVQPIFLVGTPHSGTSWVYRLLIRHPEVAGALETRLFTGEAEAGVARARAIEALVAHAEHHRFVVERSAGHVFALDVIARAVPSAKFVHVLRDGRDVAVTAKANYASWPGDWKSLFGRSFPALARSWAEAARIAGRVRDELPDRFMEVRFEDMQQDPWRGYEGILDFCGMPYDERFLAGVFSSDGGRLRRGGPVGIYKERLNVYNAWRIEKAAGQVLRHTDYEDNEQWWWSPIRR